MPYEGPDARNPALSSAASPGLEKPTSCCRRGKVTAQLPRPACDPATCRAWQAPELPLPPAARAATGLARLPREAGWAGDPSRPVVTPTVPADPAAERPPRFPGVLRRQRRPLSRSPGPGQSCVGETAQLEGAGGGGRRERKGERAQHRFGLHHPPRRGKRRAGSTTARASHPPPRAPAAA